MNKKIRRPQKVKSRFAKILFGKDSPFKQKVVRNKSKYTRKMKHPSKGEENE